MSLPATRIAVPVRPPSPGFITGGCYGIVHGEFSTVFHGSALRRPRPGGSSSRGAPDRPRPQPGLARLASSISTVRCLSAVPGCFLNELHPRGQPEFGVDVGEVGLHG